MKQKEIESQIKQLKFFNTIYFAAIIFLFITMWVIGNGLTDVEENKADRICHTEFVDTKITLNNSNSFLTSILFESLLQEPSWSVETMEMVEKICEKEFRKHSSKEIEYMSNSVTSRLNEDLEVENYLELICIIQTKEEVCEIK